jgi:hypothetical protein
MAFTADDFRDLLKVLEDHPEWKQELRRIVLTEDVLAMPLILRELAANSAALSKHVDSVLARMDAERADHGATQKRVDERLEALAAAQERTEAELRELAAAQRQTDARFEALAAAQQEMAAAQRQMDARFEELATALRQTMQRLDTVTYRVDSLRGSVLEIQFRERAPAYLGSRGFRRARVVPISDWADRVDDAVGTGRITSAERDDLLLADAVVQARDADGELLLVVEISATVDTHDVERARRRAALAARLDSRARGVVAGHVFTAGAEAALREDSSLLGVRLPDN